MGAHRPPKLTRPNKASCKIQGNRVSVNLVWRRNTVRIVRVFQGQAPCVPSRARSGPLLGALVHPTGGGLLPPSLSGRQTLADDNRPNVLGDCSPVLSLSPPRPPALSTPSPPLPRRASAPPVEPPEPDHLNARANRIQPVRDRAPAENTTITASYRKCSADGVDLRATMPCRIQATCPYCRPLLLSTPHPCRQRNP